MPVFDVYDVSKLEVEMLSGKEDVGAGNGAKQAIYYDDGVPGIVWFRRSGGREYEVLEYDWNGPRFTDVMIQDNQTSTNTFSKRKGRVAGALIGTILVGGNSELTLTLANGSTFEGSISGAIVNAKGELAGELAFGGAGEQAKLLKAEGIEVINGRVDLTRYQWKSEENAT